MAHIAACMLAVAGVAYGQLTLTGVRCGQLTCAVGEYCSRETDRCAPCSDICNNTHHNYDAGLCIKECQGYIHDLRYLSRTEGTGSAPDIKSVQQQARAALIISCVALAVLVVIMLLKCLNLFRDHQGKFSLRHLRQKLQPSKNQVKQYPMDLTHHNPHADMGKPKHELKLEIRNTNPEPPKRENRQTQILSARALNKRNSGSESQGRISPKTVSTSCTNRHPAEDTTLDNPYTYDNMGMNVTPPAQTAASHF